MDFISLLCYFILLYLAVQVVRFIVADADLSLMWAEFFGQKPEKKLSDAVVWITGASSGIGEELAYQLAKIGAKLVLSARRKNELERVKQRCLECSRLQENNLLVLPLDLNQRETHEEATKRVIQHFGRIDVLVNNAGRSQRSLFVDTQVDVYKAIMDLNYLGTVSITKNVLSHMMEKRKGQIVNLSSLVGIVAAPLSSGYSASKHALHGFFDSLTAELLEYPEINIVNICPGPVQSSIVKNAFCEDVSKVFETCTDQLHKMPTARCVRLMLVGMANNLPEIWISDQPYLFVCYLWQYAPTWGRWLLNKMSKRRILNFKSGLDADVAYFTKLKTH
ncbi:dehydrogenase/reductase SDR family member 7 [Protopterus annectens]|uniref:dehydrogenase/reductase SDR family member 7 n=1 Tax=Protopterus annectens TaxID=7888 RepID=UPI001CFA9B75|nr:dehydrogenase/reductase SDR family member 7 [Protopterus annectens]